MVLIVIRLQGMGVIKDSLPPVPEDKELRAKNRAQNEERKRAKEEKKAKGARKAKRRETSEKNRCVAEKAGLPVPESPETSVLEIEGGEEPHWLNELADEEDEDEGIPPVGGGIKVPEGSRAQGGSKAPEGSQAPGGARVAPLLLLTLRRTEPRKVALSPRVLERGKRRQAADPRWPRRTVAPEGPIEPAQRLE